MKKSILIGLLISSLGWIACDEDCDVVFCDNSGTIYHDVNVKLTINDENPEVELVIFRGKADSKDTIIHEFISETRVRYELESGYYSGAARYVDGFKEIVAVNGKHVTTRTDDCGCEAPRSVNLNLKLAR